MPAFTMGHLRLLVNQTLRRHQFHLVRMTTVAMSICRAAHAGAIKLMRQTLASLHPANQWSQSPRYIEHRTSQAGLCRKDNVQTLNPDC